MINIKVFKANGKYKGFECSGHSGYANFGQDIICASVSTLCGSCHLGLRKVLNEKLKFEIDEEKPYFSLELVSTNSDKAQLLLETLTESFSELATQHKKFIKLEIIGG